MTIKGIKEFEAAIKRHPEAARAELNTFFIRAQDKLRSRIRNNPWRMGQSGGGAPVDTGNLRDGMIGAGKSPLAELKNREKDGAGHVYERNAMSLRIYPTASYAKYVHGIEGYPRKRSYQLRPWLDFALKKETPEIKRLERELLKNLVANLAK
jgi:hypothetical protein